LPITYQAIPFNSGLNNQKLSILGSFLFAQDNSGYFDLPAQLVDFKPGSTSKLIQIDSAFNLLELKKIIQIQHYSIQESKANEMLFLNNAEMFIKGSREQRQSLPDTSRGKLIGQFLYGFRPSDELQDLVSKIKNIIRDAIVLSLRIEADWKRHSLKKRPLMNGEIILLKAEEIFSKIANTPGLSDAKNIYCCCDEADLEESLDVLKKIAKSFGFDAIFKGEFSDTIKLPQSQFLNSIVDFEVASTCKSYVGLTTSTFSNNIAYISYFLKNDQRNWVYNIEGYSCGLRLDRGLTLAPFNTVIRFKIN
jgi:hypothetical protein